MGVEISELLGHRIRNPTATPPHRGRIHAGYVNGAGVLMLVYKRKNEAVLLEVSVLVAEQLTLKNNPDD